MKALYYLLLMTFGFLLCGVASGSDEQTAPGYKLDPGDTVTVRVFKHSEFDIQQRIDEEGNVSIPLLEEIEVIGLTLGEAEGLIENALFEGRLLAKPQVKVTIVSYTEKKAVVLGQVARPGSVIFPPEAHHMRLVDVISRAGGLTRIAKDSAIRITHTDEQGNEESREVDLGSVMSAEKKGKSMTGRQILVYQNDVVFVPERLF